MSTFKTFDAVCVGGIQKCMVNLDHVDFITEEITEEGKTAERICLNFDNGKQLICVGNLGMFSEMDQLFRDEVLAEHKENLEALLKDIGLDIEELFRNVYEVCKELQTANELRKTGKA